MQNDFEKRKHCVSMENREHIEISGVKDVPAFNEEEAQIITDYGDIILKGSNMKLDALDLDSSNVKINGRIIAVIYNEHFEPKGFFKRIFSS